MPQLRKFDWAPPFRDKVTPTIERALERIRFYSSYKPELERLIWYVQLAQKSLDALSDGEILILQEEFVAMAYTAGNYIKIPDKPNRQQIKETQQTIADNLSQLADQGQVTIGPATVTRLFTFRKTPQEQIDKGERPHTVIRAEVGQGSSNLYSHTLLNHVCELLEQHASDIMRCPHCFRIFVRERRHKQYCSRECQQVAVMRRIRKGQEKQITRKTKDKRKGHMVLGKGGVRHGKK